MVAIFEQYLRELHDEYQYFATWQPSVRLALGDVGTFSRHRFDRVTTLANLGVSFQVAPPDHRADLAYASRSTVTVAADAAAEPVMSVTVTFGREGATLLHATDCVEESIGDLPALEQDLMRLVAGRAWRAEYAVVTRLVRTGPVTVLVSNEAGARVELRTAVGAPVVPLPVPVTGGLTVTNKSGLAVSVLAADGATPLFRASHLRRKVTGRSRLVFKDSAAPVEVELAPVGWDDSAATG